MKIESIEMFLSTLCEFNTVNITQVFSSDDESINLSVRCLKCTEAFLIMDLKTEKVWRNPSLLDTALFIQEYIETQKAYIHS